MVEGMKVAIDNNIDMDSLWRLALIDTAGFFGKLSVRMMGKKRIRALYHYLLGLDASGTTFQVLLKAKVEKELGLKN